MDGKDEVLTPKAALDKIDASQKYKLQYGEDTVVIIPVIEK